MSEDTNGAEVPEEQEPVEETQDLANDLAAALAAAVAQVNVQELGEGLKAMQEVAKRFPEHAKVASYERELQMLHVFVQHYLPTKGLTIARNEGGILTPYSEEADEHGGTLLFEFLGIDNAKFDAETPGLVAYFHQLESEHEADNPDPELVAQMDEFEAMLADMDGAGEEIPEEEYR